MSKLKVLVFGAIVCGISVEVNAQSTDPGRIDEFRQMLCQMYARFLPVLPPACREPEPPSTFPEAPAANACPGHPGVRPRPEFASVNFDSDRGVYVISTPTSDLPPSNSEDNLPKNLCPTVYENATATGGGEIPNTLPSTPDEPYNLHPEPTISSIDPTSPSEDLKALLDAMRTAVASEDVELAESDIQFGLDILEGNPIERTYTGMPLLHYNGPNKVKKVEPIFDEDGNKIGGRVELRQVWFDGRIMGDTAFIDPSDVMDVPWTMVVQADTLTNGHEDFAPFQMYFDDPDQLGGMRAPHIAMDMTFFPMEDGTRTTFELKMAPGRFFNLTYYWGWRLHPPRVQVTENALKRAGSGENDRSLVEWEQLVFGNDPMGSEQAKLAAIAMIGDLAPAKRMWNLLRGLREGTLVLDEAAVAEFESAFYDWRDRLSLPSGIEYDEDFDVNVVYLNNTMYGQVKGKGNWEQTVDFNQPGDQVRIKVLNGDYFPHAYQFVDFGGLRGWENTFHSTVDFGGAGPWFTFGRAHWWPMLRPALMVPPAMPAEAPARARVLTIDDSMRWLYTPPQGVTAAGGKRSANEHGFRPAWLDFSDSPSILAEFQHTEQEGEAVLGMLPLEFHMNHTPSKRLKMYQFDPLHHDVAVWSIH
ncbi:MAG: hypothetical protein RQ729_07415 [Wenzhouxiangellaceae bacterium]|nr:hypothetical protein [Wenzhouxiangellaceae bacterium]